MDFVTLFLLIVPLITLYVRTPVLISLEMDAWAGLSGVVGTSILFSMGLWLLFRWQLRRSLQRAERTGDGVVLRVGHLSQAMVVGLSALYFAHIHVFRLKGSFERLFFSSELFLVSDLFLLLPFLLPFLGLRVMIGRTLLQLRGLPAPLAAEWRRQARTVAVMLLPQLLYLNVYRLLASDVPLVAEWLDRNPMFGFALAGTLLFLLFVLSPYYIGLLFDRVPLASFPDGEVLLPLLARLARRAGVDLSRVHVWLTRERRVANAAVSGLLPGHRTVFLTDYLIRSLPPQEVVAVVAHEVGHARFHHLAFNFLLAILSSAFVLLGLSLVEDMIETQQQLALAVVLLEAVYLLGVFGMMARRFERQADLYAAWAVEAPRLVASSLLRLATANQLSIRKGSLTHPSIASRVRRLERLDADPSALRTQRVRRAAWGNVTLAVALVVFFATALALLDSLPL
ncbi:MAG: hypothetical protein FJ109_04210 [Deltaproteobacteria bacterium]|nr:hypothetical protein [Deltaproteobacteria bacterium]